MKKISLFRFLLFTAFAVLLLRGGTQVTMAQEAAVDPTPTFHSRDDIAGSPKLESAVHSIKADSPQGGSKSKKNDPGKDCAACAPAESRGIVSGLLGKEAGFPSMVFIPANAESLPNENERSEAVESHALPKAKTSPVKPDAAPKDADAAPREKAETPETLSGPTAAGSVSSTSVYKVGAGDVLDIRLLSGAGHESTLFTVGQDGLLEYPLAGAPVMVAGMTTGEIASQISAGLARRAVAEKADVSITVRDYKSHTVLVGGLVDRPGEKPLRREAVPLYVVVGEAVPRPEAGQVILTSTSGKGSLTIDINDSKGMSTLVRAGDVIKMVPTPPQFYYIGGQVSMPGQKDFHAGLTLVQAILTAGGTTKSTSSSVKLARQRADGKLVSSEFDLKQIEAGATADPRLQAGDRIEVGRGHW